MDGQVEQITLRFLGYGIWFCKLAFKFEHFFYMFIKSPSSKWDIQSYND